MELSADKSAYTEYTGSLPPNPTPTFPDSAGHPIPVRRLPPRGSYRYLGYMINLDLNWNDHEAAAILKFKRYVGRIMALDISLSLRIECLNLIAIQSLSYYMNLVKFRKKTLEQLDTFVRKQVKRRLERQSLLPSCLLHMPRWDGGRQLWKPSDQQHITLLNTLFNYVFNNTYSIARPLLLARIAQHLNQQQLPVSVTGRRATLNNQLLHTTVIDRVLTKDTSDVIQKRIKKCSLLHRLYTTAQFFHLQLRHQTTDRPGQEAGSPAPLMPILQQATLHDLRAHTNAWNVTGAIAVFTDGSYHTDTDTAAWAVSFKPDSPYNMSSRVSGQQSNGLAELQAIETALLNIPMLVDVIIVTDSETSIVLLQQPWELRPISAQIKLQHRSTILRIHSHILARHDRGLAVNFVHIYSHVTEKLRSNRVYWQPKIDAKQRELSALCPDCAYPTTQYELSIIGNTHADTLAKQALQQPPRPAFLFVPLGSDFVLTDGRNSKEGKLSRELRRFVFSAHADAFLEHECFKKLHTLPQNIDFTISNSIFRRDKVCDNQLVDFLTIARGDKLADKQSAVQMYRHIIYGQCYEQTRSGRKVPCADQPSPTPTFIFPEHIGQPPPLEEYYQIATPEPSARTAAPTADNSSRGTQHEPDTQPDFANMHRTRIRKPRRQEIRAMYSDPYCDQCRDLPFVIPVIEDRTHMLVNCLGLMHLQFNLHRELFDYVQSAVTTNLDSIPNWFTNQPSPWCNNEDSSAHKSVLMYDRTAAMLGYMPRAITTWAHTLSLRPGITAPKLLNTINRKIVTTTMRIWLLRQLAFHRLKHQRLPLQPATTRVRARNKTSHAQKRRKTNR